MSGVLLDTCAAIWFSSGAPMAPTALDAIRAAAADRALWVSPISGWEVAAKIASGKGASTGLNVPATDWYSGLLTLGGAREAALTGAIALRSAQLPWFHRDPADRFLIATAVELNICLVTRDRLIQAYADAGIAEVLPC